MRFIHQRFASFFFFFLIILIQATYVLCILSTKIFFIEIEKIQFLINSKLIFFILKKKKKEKSLIGCPSIDLLIETIFQILFYQFRANHKLKFKQICIVKTIFQWEIFKGFNCFIINLENLECVTFFFLVSNELHSQSYDGKRLNT